MSGKLETRKTILRWLPAVAWMALIFTLSSVSQLPGPPDPWLHFAFKKSAHVGAYAILAILYARALERSGRGMAIALLLTVLYAASDEFHQSFVPGRDPQVTDVLIDFGGAVLGLAGLAALRQGYWRNSSKLT